LDGRALSSQVSLEPSRNSFRNKARLQPVKTQWGKWLLNALKKYWALVGGGGEPNWNPDLL
jgi:hypothetical protein